MPKALGSINVDPYVKSYLSWLVSRAKRLVKSGLWALGILACLAAVYIAGAYLKAYQHGDTLQDTFNTWLRWQTENWPIILVVLIGYYFFGPRHDKNDSE